MALYGMQDYGGPEEYTNWTDYINSFNPEQNPDKAYVQGGTTGGYLAGVGETIGVGKSTTPGQAAQQYASGVQQFGNSEVDDFLNRNPGDTHRIPDALGGPAGQQSRGNASPTQAWNSQPSSGSGGGQRDAFIAQLMARTQGGQVNRNSPNVRAQVDPIVAQQERASRGYLDDVAERGGPFANMQGERRLVAERSGQAAGALESQVIGRELEAERDQVAQALELLGDQLSLTDKLALEERLAQLDAETRRYGYDVGADTARYGIDSEYDQFLRDLALREYDTTNRWDYENRYPRG